MATVNRTVPSAATSPPDESWVTDLNGAGEAGQLALRHLHEVVLRASRYQVWRLRDLLPGAGVGELEDLAQQAADDALVAVLRQLTSFEGRSRFTTWAYKFGVYQAGAAVRRQAWRNREVPLPDTLPLMDASPSPADLSEAAQLASAVRDAIESALTPHQRRVALALLVEQVPIDVLADRLGTTRNALYKTLHDARHKLRIALADGGHLDNRSHRRAP